MLRWVLNTEGTVNRREGGIDGGFTAPLAVFETLLRRGRILGCFLPQMKIPRSQTRDQIVVFGEEFEVAGIARVLWLYRFSAVSSRPAYRTFPDYIGSFPSLRIEGEYPEGPGELEIVRDRFWFRYYLDSQRVSEEFVKTALENPEWFSLGSLDFSLAGGDIQLARRIHGRPVIEVWSFSALWSFSADRKNILHNEYCGFLLDLLPSERFQVDERTVVVPTTPAGEMLVEFLSRHWLDKKTAGELQKQRTPEGILAELLAREF